MTLTAHNDPMTEVQSAELKTLYEITNIPDKSGGHLTRQGAQEVIDAGKGPGT